MPVPLAIAGCQTEEPENDREGRILSSAQGDRPCARGRLLGRGCVQHAAGRARRGPGILRVLVAGHLPGKQHPLGDGRRLRGNAVRLKFVRASGAGHAADSGRLCGHEPDPAPGGRAGEQLAAELQQHSVRRLLDAGLDDGGLHPGAECGRLDDREPRVDRSGRQAGHSAMELHHRRGGDRRRSAT